MVDTRILEQRLGWRNSEPDQAAGPPPRPMGHSPKLQGRVEHANRAAPKSGSRRVAVDEAWERLPSTFRDIESLVGRAGRVPAIDRGSASGSAFDQLRTQMMRVVQANDWTRIGVTSPARGAGRSFFAAGLAASVARIEAMRVLLIDADLEEPGLGKVLGTRAPGPMEEILTGRREPETQLIRTGAGLAVALNSKAVKYGAELFLSHEAIRAINDIVDMLAPNVVILDMPPLLNDTASQALLPQLDAVILVSDGLSTSATEIVECERLLDGQVPLLGVALNKSEDRDPRVTSRRRI